MEFKRAESFWWVIQVVFVDVFWATSTAGLNSPPLASHNRPVEPLRGPAPFGSLRSPSLRQAPKGLGSMPTELLQKNFYTNNLITPQKNREYCGNFNNAITQR